MKIGGLSRICFLLVLSLLLVGFTRGGLSVASSTYDGLVATRGSAPSGKATQTQAMSVTAVFTRSAVTKIKIIIPNWYNGESAPGGALTVKASIEYPPGTCTPFTFSSASSGTASDGGQIESDYLTIAIPTNTKALIREFLLNSAGIPVDAYQGQNLSLGDALILGNSGVVDQTVSCGTVADGGTLESIAPLAIIAPITAPSVCIYGDSIALGVNADHIPNSVGDNGEIAPSIGPSFGYSNMGSNGDLASQFIAAHTNRVAVATYCTHAIVEYGSNDFSFGGSSVAALETDLTTIYGYFSGKVVFQNTLLPRTCSTDNWVTVVNQTPEGTGSCNLSSNFESKRNTFDTALTGGSFGPNGGYFDPVPVLSTGTNNSVFKAGAGFPACSPWVGPADGAHPSNCSYYTALPTSGYIDTSRIHR